MAETKYPMTARAIGVFFDEYKKTRHIGKACDAAGITRKVFEYWKIKAAANKESELCREFLRELEVVKMRLAKRKQRGGNRTSGIGKIKKRKSEIDRRYREKKNPKPKKPPVRKPAKVPRNGEVGRCEFLIDLDRMELYGMMGFTPTMIAARENCSQATIYQHFRKREKDQMWSAYQRGVASGDALLVETAYKKAVAEGKEGSVPMLIFLLKSRVGMRETTNVSVDIVPTDVSEKLKELAEKHGVTYDEILKKYNAIEV